MSQKTCHCIFVSYLRGEVGRLRLHIYVQGSPCYCLFLCASVVVGAKGYGIQSGPLIGRGGRGGIPQGTYCAKHNALASVGQGGYAENGGYGYRGCPSSVAGYYPEGLWGRRWHENSGSQGIGLTTYWSEL